MQASLFCLLTLALVAAFPAGQSRTPNALTVYAVDVEGPAAPAPGHDGPAYWIKASAQANGTFAVTNARNNFTKTYMVKR